MSVASVHARAASPGVMPQLAAPLLQVRGLEVAFRSGGAWREVVRDLSFDLEPRETLAVVGESGSGKSVTALSIMRLLPPAYSRHSGHIRLDGRDLLTCSPQEMRAIRGDRIAMIFQEPMTSLNPVLTIGTQIGESVVRHMGLSISRLHNASQKGANGRSRSAIWDHMRLASYPSKLFRKRNIASTVPRQIVHMQNICGRIHRREARIR